MQTVVHPNLRNIAEVKEAESIIRSCVHCGFCNAVCPTYQLLGDELDGPRGRIYLLKNLLEQDRISAKASVHMDRCLTCRSCESVCPSGVRYGRLLDIGREMIAERQSPVFIQRFMRWSLRKTINRTGLLNFVLRLAQVLSPMLPGSLARKIPPRYKISRYEINESDSPDTERVLLLRGCVQKAATPNVTRAIEYLLSLKDVQTSYLDSEGCCGALDYHLSAHDDAMTHMKDQIDQLLSKYDAVDWILSSASGCGVTIKEYPEIMKNVPGYYEKARKIASKVLDVSEYLSRFQFACEPLKVAVHTPCTLQHGQKKPDAIEALLNAAGAELIETGEKHLCCGSAGTYSILQPEIANGLTTRKVDQLEKNTPDIIVTGNVGCQLQLQNHASTQVVHWVEFLADNIKLPVSNRAD